jgi:acetyl esterase/lipase
LGRSERTVTNPTSWIFLGAAAAGAWLSLNAYVPVRRPAVLATVSFFAGWLTTELALHHIAWQALVTLAFVALGALGAWPGWLALGLTIASWALLLGCLMRARRAERVVESSLSEALGARYREAMPDELAKAMAPAVDLRQLLLPFPVRHPEVLRERDIVYSTGPGFRMKLDVYRKKGDGATKRPALLQIHGGGWVLGSKNEQGLPLVLHLASRGWVCVSVDYRLAPRATFPEPLIDLKRALAWIREHADELGVDPDFVVVTGGSAGGHLASLVALTENDPEYQPGFEGADTSVQGCVAFYGVYDFTDRHRVWPHRGLERLLERAVMKAPLDGARGAWEKASPMSRVHRGAPPFFVIHGDRDTMVPVEEARLFVDALRRSTGSLVAYAEIPGAQHAFEVFPSLRTTFVIHGVERFLAAIYAKHVAARSTPRLVDQSKIAEPGPAPPATRVAENVPHHS